MQTLLRSSILAVTPQPVRRAAFRPPPAPLRSHWEAAQLAVTRRRATAQASAGTDASTRAERVMFAFD